MKTEVLEASDEILVYGDDGNPIDRQKIIRTYDGNWDRYCPINYKHNSGSFLGRIKDAVEAVKEGYADCIRFDNESDYNITVYRLIDRRIGEIERQSTLDIFKNAKFAYIVRIFNPTFSYPGYSIEKGGTLTSIAYHDLCSKRLFYFSSEEEVENYINTLKPIIQDMNTYYEKIGTHVNI